MQRARPTLYVTFRSSSSGFDLSLVSSRRYLSLTPTNFSSGHVCHDTLILILVKPQSIGGPLSLVFFQYRNTVRPKSTLV